MSEAEYVGLQKRTMDRKRAERMVGSYAARRQMRAPKGDFAMWLRTAWWQVVDSQLRAHHGRGVDIATAFFSDAAEENANRTRVAEYFWRESGKWKQKTPPPYFGSLRFYGRWGGNKGFKPVVTEAELDERTAIELRRVLRRMQLGKRAEMAKRTGYKLRKNSCKSRGLDGLTVFEIDGREIGPRLLDWAQDLASQKATGADVTRRGWVSGGGEPWMRAWSEFRYEPAPSPEQEDEGPDLPEDEEDEWAAVEVHIARLEAAEAEIWAKAMAFEDERERREARELRKTQLRQAERSRRFGKRGQP